MGTTSNVSRNLAEDLAYECLGRVGRMISADKTAPAGEQCVFNANVLTKRHGKLWYGDLNLVRDRAKLLRLARELAEPVYVLREHDARFTTEKDPRWDAAVAMIQPSDLEAA